MGTETKYAGLAYRFGALVIDFMLLSAVFFPVTRLVKGTWLMSAGDHSWSYGWIATDPLCLVFLAIIVLYFIVAEAVFGATIGKKAIGLQIVSLNGAKPGFRRAVVRNILRIIDALPAFNILGVILIIVSPERARLGDRIAGTRVILR